MFPKRVLTIQSHVVFGYVGNRSAVFPMQLHGLDVDVLDTVCFATHTGYGKPVGTVLDGKDLGAILDGLKERTPGNAYYDFILTGE